MTPSNTLRPMVTGLRWEHLRRLTGPHGLFEHAEFDEPRHRHGYTTDDNARALVVAARFAHGGVDFSPYLDLVLLGRTASGWHNRMSERGRWMDRIGSPDSHGRALWGLGEILPISGDPRVELALNAGLETLPRSDLRTLSYAAFGAVAAAECGSEVASRFLLSAANSFPQPRAGAWMWPEEKLTYANARIPEAMILTGRALDDDRLVSIGLELLDWLIGIESSIHHFSFTPVGGRGPIHCQPSFDQQPIEAWAMADACHAASLVDGSRTWVDGGRIAAEWFLGRNDSGISLYDPRTGAGYDGLGRDSMNLNRGAESTLSALGALGRLFEWRDDGGD